ncbi:hypothetical protein ALC57_14514, partial [Trachymyrmex cornetzi]
IETIKQKIRTVSTAAVTALHKLVFEEEGDRKNRQRLRDFKGFTFRSDTPEYTDKLECGRRLMIGDLISCCNILGLEYHGSKEEIITRIVHELMNLNTLVPKNNDEEVSYRDVEGSIKTFTGKDAYPVERWVSDFEDTADLFECKQCGARNLEVRCYNCGAKGHKYRDCKKKELGKKCFKCQKFGHAANLCNATDESKVDTDKKISVINTDVVLPINRMLKQITVNGHSFNIYETEVHTDASINSYEAVLMQRSPDNSLWHSVYFMSRKTKKEEINYSSYESGTLAIVEALNKFRIYLLGIRFKIITDCATFQRTKSKKDLISRIAG